MVKFHIEKKTVLGRLGKIESWGPIEISHQTPSCLQYTQAGHIPHLTWEVAGNQLSPEQPPIYQISLPSLFYTAETIKKFGKSAAKFCGMPKNVPIHLTPLDPLGKLPTGFNFSTSIAIWTPNGKANLDVKNWRQIVNSFGCQSFETLVDYDLPRKAGGKRHLKASERTNTLYEQMFQQDEKVYGEKVLSLGGGFQKYYRRKAAVDLGLQEGIAAYSVEFHDFTEGKEEKFEEKEVQELLEETFSPLPPTKLRMMSGPFNPKMILLLVKNGIDLFDNSFAVKLTEEGHAFRLHDGFPTSSTGFEIVDFNEERFADDWTTPFENCQCYTCSNYKKGYLQHLLNTKELLASILLVIHNISEYDRMFKLIRQSLENSEGI